MCSCPPLNRIKMAAWAAKVATIVNKPPGNDEGFPPESIARESQADFSGFSTWSIVCEEVLDTEFPRVYFVRAHEELKRRGISAEELVEMRRLAWLTAGWLNFEMMLWDWCGMDVRDIYRAIEWQFSDGWISKAEREGRIAFAKRHDKPA